MRSGSHCNTTRKGVDQVKGVDRGNGGERANVERA